MLPATRRSIRYTTRATNSAADAVLQLLLLDDRIQVQLGARLRPRKSAGKFRRKGGPRQPDVRLVENASLPPDTQSRELILLYTV